MSKMRLWRERGIKGERVPLWGWGYPPSPSVTPPLLTYKYICSILDLKSRHQPNLPKEEPNNQGSPPDPPEDSTPQPIPTALTRGLRLKQTPPSPLYKGPGYPFPYFQAMECPQTIRGRPRPTTPLPIQRSPSSGAFTPAHCAPVFPVGQPTPGLARPSCPCLSRRPSHPSTRRMHRDAGYESPPQAVSSPSAVRSSAAAGGIGPTQP